MGKEHLLKKGRKEERKKECVFNHAGKFENELSYLKFLPFKCLLLGCCFLTETRTITYYNCVWTSSIFMIKSRIFIIQRKLDYRGCFTPEDVLLDQKMRVRTMKIVILQYSSTVSDKSSLWNCHMKELHGSHLKDFGEDSWQDQALMHRGLRELMITARHSS